MADAARALAEAKARADSKRQLLATALLSLQTNPSTDPESIANNARVCRDIGLGPWGRLFLFTQISIHPHLLDSEKRHVTREATTIGRNQTSSALVRNDNFREETEMTDDELIAITFLAALKAPLKEAWAEAIKGAKKPPKLTRSHWNVAGSRYEREAKVVV
jgi:hypothetical protein